MENGCDYGDEPVRVKFGENVCYRVDNEDFTDCAEFMADDTFLGKGLYLNSDGQNGLRAVSCSQQFSTFQKGCGCQRYKKNPQACNRNDCVFIQRGDIFSKMPPERQRTCRADLGCREWDDCNFKCKEFCELKGTCKWSNGKCDFAESATNLSA